MAVLQEYKCPCCGGAIAFDSASQKMKCPYCDTVFEVDALKGFKEDLSADAPDNMSWETKAGNEWSADESSEMRSFVCQSCGGEIIGDQNTAATACPYCGNPVVMKDNFSGMLKPDMVIPFKHDKKAAKAAYLRHIQGKRLLPRAFKEQNHIDEIKGVYVPVWLFDANVDANIRYKATRVRTWSDSDYRYEETSYYSVVREGSLQFEAVPVDGSSKMADELMESVEPFDLADAVDFQTAYMAGYLADKYDVDAAHSIDRANARIKNSTERSFANTVQGFTTVTAEAGSIRTNNGKAKYAFYPVWVLNTTYNGEKYTFVMNGQTGKMVGNLPVDKQASRKMLAMIAGIGTVALFGLQYLMWLL